MDSGAERRQLNGDKGQGISEGIDQGCKEFIEGLVEKIFNNSSAIVQEDNAEFGVYSRTPEGRLLFSRLVDSRRVNSKRVSEQTFYRLVQFFAVCLFECNEADDYIPAKHLMNMCFTFYHYSEEEEDRTADKAPSPADEAETSNGSANDGSEAAPPEEIKVKSFLYTHLKEQPIWKSKRFWNASFFESVHHEREQQSPDGRRGHWRHMSSEEQELAEIMEENITFGQLATFLHNMMALGLSQQFCTSFLEKMGTIGNITADQHEMLMANITAHFKSSKEPRRWSVSSLGTPIKQRLTNLMKLPKPRKSSSDTE
ncbi:uncharacterized protein KIAA0513-like [Diadema setosum]|uniref:uncharacterized protein KIAA0513-like n=1 Tax=Diadema setosum TaxID=31175 RepID=UPI003B3AB40D